MFFFKYPLLSTSIWGLFLVFGTYMVIRKRKKVIIINPRGILLYRIVGWKEKDQSRLFVEWKEVKDIRFSETSFGLDLKIYHKKKGCILVDISDYIGVFQGRKRYRQFKKDVFHYYNRAKNRQ